MSEKNQNPSLEVFAQNLAAAPLVAILRGVSPETILPMCEALVDGGVRFIEVTLNSPDPYVSIRKAAERFKGSGVHLGAGTVLTMDEVARVAEAGGSYIISPNTNPAVIRRTKELELISIPGFMTPSEAFVATQAGADFIKCFPVGSLGPGYIKNLRAVLATPILAVGGVSTDNIADYLKAGAAGVGVGSALFTAKATPESIRRNSAAFLAAVGR